MTEKAIVITGCSSGFGRCTALELASRGWHVFATVRKEADRESLLAEAMSHNCQENLTPLLCDITHEAEVTALAREVEASLRSGEPEALPRLDALLNNAGSAYGGPIELMPMDIYELNLN